MKSFFAFPRVRPPAQEQAGEALSLVLASETKLESAVLAGIPSAIETAGKLAPKDPGVQQAISKVARLIASSQSSKTAGSVAGMAKIVYLQLLAFPTEREVLEAACNALMALAQSKAHTTRNAVEALMGDEGVPVQKARISRTRAPPTVVQWRVCQA